MFLLESYPGAVAFCILTMLCWGSWANTQKLAGRAWRFELFYWDYVWGVVLLAVVAALTLGSWGTAGRSFAADLAQADPGAIGSAMLGGALFNLANLLLVAAIAVAGMAVAFPVGIGIALVLGVLVNYFATPVGSGPVLAAGVALVAAAIGIDAVLYRRLPGQSRSVSTKGLVLSVACGLLMGFFYRFVAAAMAENFAVPETGRLTPYTAFFCFALGLVLSNLPLNTAVMRRPFVGEPVSFADYAGGSLRVHAVGMLGGAIWGIGMLSSIIASGPAGFAISYGLGQGATMVAALWGVFVWKEFKDGPAGTSGGLVAMFAAFIGGLALIIAARVV